jgi:hypothetical protein
MQNREPPKIGNIFNITNTKTRSLSQAFDGVLSTTREHQVETKVLLDTQHNN